MRQARATLTYGSPKVGDGVVEMVVKSGVEGERQDQLEADFTQLLLPRTNSWR